jgi:DnaJ-domain-containing protein 1
MIDCFALLDEPRRPWLDAEALKEKFLSRSATAHPDHVHSASPAEREAASDRFSALNAAHTRLRDPKDRLAHLLELELGRRPAEVQAVPEDATELFLQVGQICRETDQFIAGRANVTSPLLKVQSFERGLAIAGRVTELQRTLERRQAEHEAELKSLNEAWTAAPPVDSPARLARLPLERVEELYRAFSYLARWRAQLQERFVQLAM